jgi:hypothetical protein
MASDHRFVGYREFWSFYVGEHRRPATRWLHFVGTTMFLLCLVLAAILGEPWLLLLGPLLAYGPAWIGHFFIERNRPATFRHPLRSLIADFHMYGLMWLGRMEAEIARLDGRAAPGNPR